MSLELALAENTAALHALHALLAHLQSGLALSQPTPEEVDVNIKALNAEQPQTEEKTAPEAKKPAEPETPPAKATKPAKTEAEGAPDYATTAAAVNALVKARGRQVAVDVLASFKATSLKDVKPEQFAQVIAACQQAAQAEAVQ